MAGALASCHAGRMPKSDREIELTRRELMMAGAGATFLAACAGAPVRRTEEGGSSMDLTLTVNGEKRSLRIDPRTTLLDLLRENLGLTGTKKACDMGQCGACTVLADGTRIDSCLALAMQMEGREITTIEGLARGGELHPLQ